MVMKYTHGYEAALKLLMDYAGSAAVENVPLELAAGRVLAGDFYAMEDVPSFERSPYDGYAMRSADIKAASKDRPVVLSITEEIAAGKIPQKKLAGGTAAKVMTGAMLPEGADCVEMFEKTDEATPGTVKLSSPLSPGENVIRAGEDVKKGCLLARSGAVIDPGLAGSFATQGVTMPTVFRRPKAGLISTGSEIVPAEAPVPAGKIRNSNRYSLTAALTSDGCEVEWFGIAGDDTASIADLIQKALDGCDIILLTGGVSVGDYDLTKEAMEAAGIEILVCGVGIKPGMACCYGVRAFGRLHKLVIALSGNPASALTNYYGVVRGAVKRLCGLSYDQEIFEKELFEVRLAEDYHKKSMTTRLLRGRLGFRDGHAELRLSQDQGNIVLSSTIGANMMAIVPAGSPPLKAGTVLKGFLL
jgi:molybdopterin molybdotransferase